MTEMTLKVDHRVHAKTADQTMIETEKTIDTATNVVVMATWPKIAKLETDQAAVIAIEIAHEIVMIEIDKKDHEIATTVVTAGQTMKTETIGIHQKTIIATETTEIAIIIAIEIVAATGTITKTGVMNEIVAATVTIIKTGIMIEIEIGATDHRIEIVAVTDIVVKIKIATKIETGEIDHRIETVKIEVEMTKMIVATIAGLDP